MLVLDITPGATTTVGIPATVSLNTNENLTFINGNTIQVNAAGVYEIMGIIECATTDTGETGFAVYANGEAYGNPSVVVAGSSPEQRLMTIYNAIKINSTSAETNVKLTIMPVNNPTIVSGTVSVKRIA